MGGACLPALVVVVVIIVEGYIRICKRIVSLVGKSSLSIHIVAATRLSNYEAKWTRKKSTTTTTKK